MLALQILFPSLQTVKMSRLGEDVISLMAVNPGAVDIFFTLGCGNDVLSTASMDRV